MEEIRRATRLLGIGAGRYWGSAPEKGARGWMRDLLLSQADYKASFFTTFNMMYHFIAFPVNHLRI
jgi:hypothetical protein